MISINLAKPQRVENKELLSEIRKKVCVVCGGRPSDPSHVRSKGSGGPDEDWNVIPHCRSCHMVWHRVGPWVFCQKHPRFKSHLETLGWYWDGFRLRHPNLEKGTA